MTIGCALIPRFSLLAALGDRSQMLTEPVALAPEPGREQAIGEASGAAEAFGIRAGMALSEALSRCPALALIPPDPGHAATRWEGVLRALEGIGAAVESGRAGECFFAVDGLQGIWGPRPENVLARAATAVGTPGRLAGGPNRFCALAVATTTPRGSRRRSRLPTVIGPGAERGFLSPLPVALLAGRLGPGAGGLRRGPEDGGRRLIATLERLGVATLGELAELPRIAIADRFGAAGLRAHDLASGKDVRLCPRRPHEELIQAIGLPEAAYGAQLERALELLIERLLADPRRERRAIRSLRLEARLAGGGSWSAEAVMRSATDSTERLRLALRPKLAGLFAPAVTLGLRALELGPTGGDQPALAADPSEERQRRLAEAVRQVRAAAGRDAVLRVLDVDPDSRVPERWATLAPYNELRR